MLILQIKISKAQDLMTLEMTGMKEGIGKVRLPYWQP